MQHSMSNAAFSGCIFVGAGWLKEVGMKSDMRNGHCEMMGLTNQHVA